MNKRIWMILSTLIVIGALLLGACASSPIILPIEPTAIASSESPANATQSSSQTAETSQGGSLSGAAPSSGSPPEGAPTSGSPPNGDMNGGPGPSGASSSATDGLSTATGAYTLDGQNATQTGQTYSASSQDESAIYVTNGAQLTLSQATINTSGTTSSTDNSSFYGLNAGVLAASGSSIDKSDNTVSTTGTSANGVFATSSGSSVSLSNVTINAIGNGAHGVMASAGGTLSLTDVHITTTGASACSALGGLAYSLSGGGSLVPVQ